MTRIEKFCQAVKEHEGWYPGSRAFRNHNPGNFRCSALMTDLGAIRCDDNFSVFADDASGWNALVQFVTYACKNELRAYKDKTIYGFFEVYAPSGDNNTPRRYAEIVAAAVGVSPDSKMAALLEEIPAAPEPAKTRYFRYGHAADLFVKVGDIVKKGQKIGTIGKGGPNNFSAHVHFDIPKNKLANWTSFVINKSKEFVAENYADPEPFKKIVLPNFSHEGLDYLEFWKYPGGPAYHPGDDLNSGSGDSDFGHPFFSACDGIVVYAYAGTDSNNGWGKLLVVEENNQPNPNPPMEGKSKVEPELRDALKYAHDLEIGEYIDPKDQLLMAEHLRLLKDSEMATRKKIDAVRGIVA